MPRQTPRIPDGPPQPHIDRRFTAVPTAELDALEVVYDAYAARAYAIAWSILGTRAGADDAVADGTLDYWRRCRDDRPASVSGDWLLCRVSVHALDDRQLGHGVPGRLSGLTETQCQVLALACAGRMSRARIAAETDLSPTTVARTMTQAMVRLRGPAPARPAPGRRGGPTGTRPDRALGHGGRVLGHGRFSDADERGR